MNKKFTSVIALALVVCMMVAGCGGGSTSGSTASGGAASGGATSGEATSGGGASAPAATPDVETMDMTEYAISLATPLSPEDAEIYANIEAKSDNPDKIVIRHGTPARSWDEQPPQRTDRQFFIELKKRLGDKIEIQVYYNGTLGSTADQILGGLQNRSFESHSYNLGAFAEYTNAFLPFDVMYLIPDMETGGKLVAGEPGEIMRQKCLADTGLYILHYTAIGMRHTTNSKQAIRTPEDMSGLKIRVQNNPLHIQAMTALGAAPTPIAYSELYTSLQQGVIDGQENPISNIYEMNMGEVQDYLTFTNHLYTAGTIAWNYEWYQEQSDEFKKAVEESMAIAGAYAVEEMAKVEQGMLDYISKDFKEITTLTDEEYAAFRELSMTTWDKAAESIGVDYFNQVRDSIDRAMAS